MRIGIIGSGKIGSTVARLAHAAGHDVAIANRRGPESLEPLVGELGDRAQAGTVADVAAFGEVILVATPVRAYDALPPEAFAGKIVIDAGNYYPQRDGDIAELDEDRTTSSEQLAARLSTARVIKAFNTMYYETLGRAGDASLPDDERLAIPVAGDDAEAKHVVTDLVEELGFAAIDSGTLADGGRRQQPGAPVYGADLTGAQAGELLSS
jgi:8-hydroxy-5-deazaflavin:NADPH oxidoreductase